jgi:flagellar biogenesis protein FliO
MNWTNIFMVPLIMVCALGGTVGLIWLIRRFAFKQNGNATNGISGRSSNND